MYLFVSLLGLVDRLGAIPVSGPAMAGCGDAPSGSGLGGVLATSAYDRLGSLSSCRGSWTCGASGMLLSWGVASGTSPGERVPSPEGGVSTSVWTCGSMQGL